MGFKIVLDSLPSSNWLGHWPFTPKIRDRAPLGVVFWGCRIKVLHKILILANRGSNPCTPTKKFLKNFQTMYLTFYK